MNDLCYNFHWHLFNDLLLPRAVREFVDNGARRFVFTHNLAKQVMENPERGNVLRRICREMDVEFVSMHGLCGVPYDLNIPCNGERNDMLRGHVRAMELAARFGSKTYTVHVGSYFHCVKHVPLPELRKFAGQSLEYLVPEAERIGIVLAVENNFEPPNSAHEILALTQPFLSNPAIGLCYDSGHANCMASAPGKKIEEYIDYFRSAWWEKGIIQEDNALEMMAPHVVTCHMHDNSGYADLHALPGDGTIDWKIMVPKLKACPRMLEMQTEVDATGSMTYAGKSPAPAGGYSVKRLTEKFRELGF